MAATAATAEAAATAGTVATAADAPHPSAELARVQAVALALLCGGEVHSSATSATFQRPDTDPAITPSLRGWSTIRFFAPESVVEHFRAAVRMFRDTGAGREPLPIWAAVARILAAAAEVWSRTDPETRSKNYRVHLRDEHRCSVPAAVGEPSRATMPNTARV